MNRRQTVLILVLLTAVLCLAAAIISSRVSGVQPEPAGDAEPAAERGAIELFPGSNGRWGARTANGRILIEPKWYYLRKMSDTILIARDSNGKADRFGLINIAGEQLVPFLYHAITPANDAADLWIASFTENEQPKYHLYHADGTRWSDTAWDTCSYDNGVLSVTAGAEQYEGSLRNGRIVWQHRYTEYPVGLHTLVMDLDGRALAQLPPGDTVSQLGEAAAGYLRYLFVTGKAPDASVISAEDVTDLLIDYRYNGCRLNTAEVRRMKMLKTEGFPSYLVEMRVNYLRKEADGTTDRIETTMDLVIARNAAGAYTYSSFSDTQLDAAGEQD